MFILQQLELVRTGDGVSRLVTSISAAHARRADGVSGNNAPSDVATGRLVT